MRSIVLISLAVLATPAPAEVVSASSNGFHVRHSVQLVVPTANAFDSFMRVGSWWDDEHTYSGAASNLSLSPSPGSCFCERLPDGGGIEHLRVTYVKPGERMVLTGALGPLLFEATAGVMDVRVERIAGGSRVTLDYKAAGFASGGAERLARSVDQVLAQQMRRFRAFAASQSRSSR